MVPRFSSSRRRTARRYIRGRTAERGRYTIMWYGGQMADEPDRPPTYEELLAENAKLKAYALRLEEAVRSLHAAMTMAEALIEAHIHHHTRYILVRDGNLEEIVGYVNVKDIVSALQINPTDPSLKGIARPVLTVSAEAWRALLASIREG